MESIITTGTLESSQEGKDQPILPNAIPRNREEKRKIMFELVRNLQKVFPIESAFTDAVLAGGDYLELYDKYLGIYEREISKMRKRRAFKLTRPNPDYFMKNFKPISE